VGEETGEQSAFVRIVCRMAHRSNRSELNRGVCLVSTLERMYDLLVGIPGAPTGGAELQQMLMSRAFIKQGVGVQFIVSGTGRIEIHEFPDGIKVIRGISPFTGPKFIRTLRPFLSFWRSARMADADVYYQRGTSFAAGYTALYCYFNKVPFVLGCKSDMDLDGTYERELEAHNRLAFRFAVKYADAVIVQSERQRDLLRQNFGRDGVVIANMYPAAEDADAESERNTVVWAGSFKTVKRPGMFVELAGRIPDQRFVMIGGPYANEPKMFSRITEQAANLPNLKLTGQLSFDETIRCLKSAKMLVLTSSSEGFPNAFLQAWSVGTPTVSTFDPDGVIARNNIGCYCHDIDSLEEKVRMLADDDAARVEMGKRAIEYLRCSHDPDVIAGQMLDVFREACAGRSR
jgi:glycosyltransferase involved in cell wall biosynthesis